MSQPRITVLTLLLLGAHQAAAPAYRNDFEQTHEGAVPDEMMVLNGSFAVKKQDGNAFLELPGDPLETFGFMAGPEDPAPSAISARIASDVTGKRFPEFGVGLRGSGGYKLWLMPIVDELQIKKGEQVMATVPYRWKPGTWTAFRLRLREASGKFLAEGKAWEHGQKEPEQWMIQWETADAPPAGRASVWGIPFSSKPIRFDDLVIGG